MNEDNILKMFDFGTVILGISLISSKIILLMIVGVALMITIIWRNILEGSE